MTDYLTREDSHLDDDTDYSQPDADMTDDEIKQAVYDMDADDFERGEW